MSTRNFQPGDSYGIGFATKSATGLLVNADSLPTGAVYRNGVLDAAVTVTVTNQTTGVYSATCTVPSGYAVGDRVSLLVNATIGGIATGDFVDHVRLVGFPNNALPNAGSGAAGGLMGSTAPGYYTAPDNSGIASIIASVGSGLGTLVTAVKTQTDKLGFDGSNNVKAVVEAYGAGLDPATLVLDVAASTHNAAGSIGHDINAAGAAADPWATALPGSYATGTAGAILGNKTGFQLAANGLDLITPESGINFRQSQALILSACAALASGLATSTATYFAAALNGNNTTPRIVAQVDQNGNRTAITLSPPA